MSEPVNGREFIRKVRKIGRKAGVIVHVKTRSGKGSHVALWYGDRRTVVKHGGINVSLLRSMLADLGISRDDFGEDR